MGHVRPKISLHYEGGHSLSIFIFVRFQRKIKSCYFGVFNKIKKKRTNRAAPVRASRHINARAAHKHKHAFKSI